MLIPRAPSTSSEGIWTLPNPPQTPSQKVLGALGNIYYDPIPNNFGQNATPPMPDLRCSSPNKPTNEPQPGPPHRAAPRSTAPGRSVQISGASVSSPARPRDDADGRPRPHRWKSARTSHGTELLSPFSSASDPNGTRSYEVSSSWHY